MSELPSPSLIWRATCGVCLSRWRATMKDDNDPQRCVSFCPDCQENGLIAPGVLNWLPDAPPPRERCEFNPATGTWAYSGEDGCWNEATACVGPNGLGHLCAECADLLRFKRYKKAPLRKGERDAHKETDQ